uniref:Ubiquitin-like domain-containing protein n=1 Tax=Ornithodoros turicata TaxID=34597 RepID=A0A2R5LJL1_9ACAR
MPRKRKMNTSRVAVPTTDIKDTKKEKQDEEKLEKLTGPQQHLREIGNIVMKSKAGLFSSNIFCKEVLDAMTQDLVQNTVAEKETPVPPAPRRTPKSKSAKHALATSILLDDSSCDESDTGLLDVSYTTDLQDEPIQHSQTTLQMLEDLEKLKNAREESYVLSDDDSLDGLLCLDDLPDKMLVMIQSDKKLFKYSMKMDETFEGIFEQLSKEFDVKPSRILLTLGEGTVQTQDTPASLGMTARDILGCIVKKFSSPTTSTPAIRKDLISLKFQCNNKRVHHTIDIGKGEQLEEALKIFAEKTSLDLSKMVVKFDGEKVDPGESPDDLGIEDGDCIDIVIRS